MVVFLIGGALFAAGLFPGPREVVGALLPDALTASMIAQEEVFKTASDCAGAWLYVVGLTAVLWGLLRSVAWCILRLVARRYRPALGFVLTFGPPVGLTMLTCNDLELLPLTFLFWLLLWSLFWCTAVNSSGRKGADEE